MIIIKRAYEPASKDDGFRILVDRLWPRGLTKQKVAADLWLKDIAPSTELRKWFGHDPAKWDQFRKKYKEQLKEKQNLIDIIRTKAKHGKVTLVYGAKDKIHNDAVALFDYLKHHE